MGLRVLARWWKRGIAIAINSTNNLAVFDLGRAVPGLDDKLVGRLNIAKHHDLNIGTAFQRHDLAYGRHPATHQTIKPLAHGFAADLPEILAWMVGPRAAGGIHRHSVIRWLSSDERVPARTSLERRR